MSSPLELGSYFVEHQTHVFLECIRGLEDSVRRELASDAYAAAAKRAEVAQKGVPVRITKRLKDEHFILLIKYRAHLPYSAMLCIALALIIGCHPQLVSQQWVRGHFKTAKGRSLPIDEQGTREESMMLIETLHLTLKTLPDNVQKALGPTLKKLLASVSNRPTADGLYADVLALHRLLRSNHAGINAVDFDTLYRLIASPYLHLRFKENERLILSPRVPREQANAVQGWSTEKLCLDAIFTHVIDAPLERNRGRWKSEVTASAPLFIDKALGSRTVKQKSSTIIENNVAGAIGVTKTALSLEKDLDRLDAYLAEPLSDPENDDVVDEDINNIAHLNWLLNGEEKFTRLEDDFEIDVIWDLEEAAPAEPEDQNADEKDRVYTHQDSPLWLLKDIPIPSFLVPLLVGAEEYPITDETLPGQTESLLKRYKSRSGKTFLWSSDLSGGAAPHRAIPCLNDIDAEQIQSVSEWIYENRLIKEDSFLRDYEENELEPRQFCESCGECCGVETTRKPAETADDDDNDEMNKNSSDSCKCATVTGTGFAYLPDGRLRPNWPHAWEIIECGSSCSCHPDKCVNRVVQRGSKQPLLVYKTETRGWGVRALADISPGEFLVEYCGEVLPNYECQERERLYDLARRTFVFGMREPNTGLAKPRWYEIDASQIGNEARWFNHCCEPNCEVFSVCIDEKLQTILGHVAFFTLKQIKVGDELTINYRMIASGREGTYRDNQPCFCGASNCRRSLYQR